MWNYRVELAGYIDIINRFLLCNNCFVYLKDGPVKLILA